MDFGKAFTFVFDDEEWIKKIGVAGLISLIPFIGTIIVAGWGFEVIRRVIREDPEPLPDWSDFGGYLVHGFLVVVIGFVYALPLILIQGCSLGFIPFLENADQEAITAVVSVATACFSCLVLLYSVFLGVVLPAAVGRYADEGEFGAAFRFGKVFSLVRNNLGSFALVFLGNLLAGLVASLGVILCVIGVLFTSAYAAVVGGHLTGQAYRKAAAGQLSEAEAVPAEDL